jgi:hypothetical protein
MKFVEHFDTGYTCFGRRILVEIEIETDEYQSIGQIEKALEEEKKIIISRFEKVTKRWGVFDSKEGERVVMKCQHT